MFSFIKSLFTGDIFKLILSMFNIFENYQEQAHNKRVGDAAIEKAKREGEKHERKKVKRAINAGSDGVSYDADPNNRANKTKT